MQETAKVWRPWGTPHTEHTTHTRSLAMQRNQREALSLTRMPSGHGCSNGLVRMLRARGLATHTFFPGSGREARPGTGHSTRAPSQNCDEPVWRTGLWRPHGLQHAGEPIGCLDAMGCGDPIGCDKPMGCGDAMGWGALALPWAPANPWAATIPWGSTIPWAARIPWAATIAGAATVAKRRKYRTGGALCPAQETAQAARARRRTTPRLMGAARRPTAHPDSELPSLRACAAVFPKTASTLASHDRRLNALPTQHVVRNWQHRCRAASRLRMCTSSDPMHR